MKLVVFGLAISSSWGSGHATLWRGPARALAARGRRVAFSERAATCYARHRDLTGPPGGELVLYDDRDAPLQRARRHLRDADVAMATSCCPDGAAATELIQAASRTTCRARGAAAPASWVSTPASSPGATRGAPPAPGREHSRRHRHALVERTRSP